ncbi:MAG: pteridine reductase [Gammaproteobacteria bacterium]|nr:pteridine reductase [Gammaproteobacteria bacterium]
MQKIRTDVAQVALVTGAARRIGAEIARTLHAAGMNVVLHYHTSSVEAEALCTSLNEVRAHSAITVAADLIQIADFDTLMQRALKPWGRLDVLVNNASRFYRTRLGAVTEAAWDDLLTSNLKAPFFLAQAAIPALTETKGCIINIADIHGDRPMRDYSAYCISKAGLIMLTKSLAKELGKKKIRVNAISPGEVIWPEGENAMTDEDKENVLGRIVLGRIADPIEIARTVLFFAQNANYITGQILAVDGGRSLKV